METIEVRYAALAGGRYFHKYIVYTDSNGGWKVMKPQMLGVLAGVSATLYRLRTLGA